MYVCVCVRARACVCVFNTVTKPTKPRAIQTKISAPAEFSVLANEVPTYLHTDPTAPALLTPGFGAARETLPRLGNVAISSTPHSITVYIALSLRVFVSIYSRNFEMGRARWEPYMT